MSKSALLTASCDGALFPTPAGTTVDAIRVLDDIERAATVAGLGGQHAPAARTRLVPAPLEVLVPPHLPARWLIGAPDAEGYVTILTEEELDGGIWLPHHHALLHAAGGPVAARVREGVSSITWADGVGVELPAGDVTTPVYGHTDRFIRQSTICGIPVLNGLPEVMGPFASFDPQPVDDTRAGAATVDAALALLGVVWPEARADILRLCRGLVLLRSRQHSRSHSPCEAPGLVLLTTDGPEKVADLLCHECAHIRLNILLSADPLITNGDEERYPSPWRQDPRPLLGLLLGVHAFVAVIGLYRRLQESQFRHELWEVVIERQTANVRAAWDILSGQARPTSIGDVVLTALAVAIEEVCPSG